MCFSHFVLYGMYYTIVIKKGALAVPTAEDWATFLDKCTPTWEAAGLYFAFIFTETIFAYTLPGLEMEGRPDESGRRLKYMCNAYASWWCTLAGLAVAHYKGWFPIESYVQHLGAVMTVAVIFGNALSVALYVYAHVAGVTHRMTGYVVYDFFMGAILHPRIGSLDIKVRLMCPPTGALPSPPPAAAATSNPTPPRPTRRCLPRFASRGSCSSSWISVAASRCTRRRATCHLPPYSCASHTSSTPTRAPRASTTSRRR